jgi:hypothetical protein
VEAAEVLERPPHPRQRAEQQQQQLPVLVVVVVVCQARLLLRLQGGLVVAVRPAAHL